MKQLLIRFKVLIITGFIGLIFTSIIIYPFRGRITRKMRALMGYHLGPSHGGSGVCVGCKQLFPDDVKTHQKAYKSEGIKQQANDNGILKLAYKGKLLEIKTTNLYNVRLLHYSKPYLLPKGKAFIKELAKRYEKKCNCDSLTYVPFTITSVTRSVESVKRLGEVNPNSIENSAHLRGKTFDISYKAFNNNKKQNEAFITILNEMRMQGMCYVKFEKNGCLHITVI